MFTRRERVTYNLLLTSQGHIVRTLETFSKVVLN